LRSRVRSRTSWTRCRSSARSWRTSGGAIHASGSRSARSNWAKTAASALSFFTLAEAIALAPQRMHHVQAEAVILRQVHQPPHPYAASNAAGVPGGSPPIT